MLKKIIAAAKGEIECDCLLKGGYILNVFTRTFEQYDVAIYEGKIVGLGERKAREIVDVTGKYIVPGFIDGHVHLESSMMTPEYYASAVMPRGTTAVVVDPHEYANVCGLEAIKYLDRAQKLLPLDIFVSLPSCVPATLLEHSGATLLASDLAEVKDLPCVIGLAELMNYVGLLNVDEVVLDKVALMEGRHIDGHAPCLHGNELQAYIAAGVSTDHECTTAYEAEEKLALGMYIMLREGSFTRDLQALYPIVNEKTLDRCLLVSDDREPEDLVKEGHMDFICKKLIKLELDPVWVFIMASWNAAQCFNLPKLGAIAPGYRADFNVISTEDNFQNFQVDKVFKGGKLIAEDGRYLGDILEVDRGKLGQNSLHISDITLGDLQIKVAEEGNYKVHVIGAQQDLIISYHLTFDMYSKDGQLKADTERDILKVAVIERHKATGNIGLGFVHGFGIKNGALASTVAHDSHNLVVVGDNDKDMLVCIKELERLHGGLVIASQGKVLASLALPVCGLVSPEPLEQVEASIQKLHGCAYKLGSKFKRPFMCLAFMTLPVVPHLKLTDLGLVDVDRFEKISVADSL